MEAINYGAIDLRYIYRAEPIHVVEEFLYLEGTVG